MALWRNPTAVKANTYLREEHDAMYTCL
eukprot:COSAG02_NODE_39367_length_418_cov_0.648903_1_plen_27_part_10